MAAIWDWGLDLIRTIQQVQSPALTAFFKIITFTGEEQFFLILLPLVYWCLDARLGRRLAVVFMLSSYLNLSLKDLFGHPRPFELDPVLKLHEASGFGLPSGHAQAAAITWTILAQAVHRSWAWIIAIILIFLVGLSRIYLGVHFPTDVFAGWAIGALVILIYFKFGNSIAVWLNRQKLTSQLIIAIALPLLLLLIYAGYESTAPIAVLLGMGVGFILVNRKISYSASGPFWQRFLRFVSGTMILMVLYFGLKSVFPSQEAASYHMMRFIRYVIVGFWVSFGAPWLFIKIGLVAKKD
jgi:membrane-associated phospholipid phosphatase